MTRADYIIVMFALTLLPYLYMTYWQPSAQGETAEILVGSDKKMEVSLNTDQRFSVKGPLGTSVIEIHDGRIRFVDSPCRGKQCIHSGWLQQAGEFAACLPNHISVAVLGHERLYDAINF
jgi:hypothetical protein